MDAHAVIEPDGRSAVSSTFVPRPRPNVLKLDFDDGVILYDPDPGLVHRLNPAAAEIWSRCDGLRIVATIERDLAATHKVPIDEIRDDVRLAISTFESLGLLDGAPADASTTQPGGRGHS
jgi:hypothetical protein